MGESELLPCPFCGGEADVSTRQDEDIWTHNIVTWTEVGCHECNYFFEGPPGIEPTPAEHWNTRALPRAGEGGEVERLREALEPFVQFFVTARSGFSDSWEDRMGPDYSVFGWNGAELKLGDLQRARAALRSSREG